MSPGHHSNHDHESVNAATLSRKLRPAITQVFVSELFVEYNQTYEETGAYYAYCQHDKKWRVCRDTFSTQWEHAEWSDPDVLDIVPMIYHDIIQLLQPMVETLSHAEQRRVMSHGFIAGVVKLLQQDQRLRITPWGLQGTVPPVEEEMEAERIAKIHGRQRA